MWDTESSPQRKLRRGKHGQPVYLPLSDYTRDFDVDIWKMRLKGVDVVINAVGILREHGQQTFAALHDRAPRALFAACAAMGVKVVQIRHWEQMSKRAAAIVSARKPQTMLC